jgi:hypothetical protein
MRVAFAERVSSRCIAGSPSRRPGNFSLSRQRKVTKRGALNRTRAPLAGNAHENNPTVHAHTRPAALSLLSLSPGSPITPLARLTRGCTPGSRETQTQRRSGDAPHAHPRWRHPSDAVFPDEPGVQPALTGVKGRCVAFVIGTAARAQRLASMRHVSGSFRAPLMVTSRWCAVQRLFFGDFLLAPQKKVTPPPGGTPGNRGASPFRQEATH